MRSLTLSRVRRLNLTQRRFSSANTQFKQRPEQTSQKQQAEQPKTEQTQSANTGSSESLFSKFGKMLSHTNMLSEVAGSLKEAKRAVLDSNASKYGGITSRAYRARIREQRLRGFSSSTVNGETVSENPNAGAGVVLHKDSKWKEAWTGFKERNPVVQGVFSLRRRVEESDNVFVNTSRVLADRFRELMGGAFEETEHAVTLAEIKHLDPSFELENFLKDTREFMIPEVLEAYVDWDVKTLKLWCSDAVVSILEASRQPLVEKGLTVQGQILDLRNVELVMAKMMDDTPLLILSFKTQQTEAVKDREGKIVAGSEDGINDVFYIWALTKDTERVQPLTQGWKVVEFAIQGVRESL